MEKLIYLPAQNHFAGFMTSKGRMVRSILYPKPFNFKFYWDSVKFILALIFLGKPMFPFRAHPHHFSCPHLCSSAGVGFVYSLIVLNVSLYNAEGSVLRAFDVITIAVPPALPAALTVGTVYALRRLRKQQIYCISPQRLGEGKRRGEERVSGSGGRGMVVWVREGDREEGMKGEGRR